MPLDFLATAPHYVDHLLPIWERLPAGERRHFYVGPRAWRDDIPGARHVLEVGRDSKVPILVVAHGDFKIARGARRPDIALGQHGAGQSYGHDHPSYPGGRDQGEASLFLVPNEHAAKRTRDRYPDARVEIVGCPKLDRLPRRRRHRGPPVVAFSFHFDSRVAPETRTTFPLYRGHVAALAKRVKVIGHAHPRYMTQLGPFYRSNRIEVVTSLEAVFERADLYVCDNSSSLFEFAATGRPVLALNAPWFRRREELGLRFWAAAGVGINVDRPRDLQAAVELALKDPPAVARARTAALRLVYQPRRGGARLAAAALLDWAAERRQTGSLRRGKA